MWAKFDDSFPNHPKVVAAGPIAALIQVRAICYCARFLTDGFVPAAVVAELVTGLEHIGIAHASAMEGLVEFGQDADDIDWPPHLVAHRLWETCDGRCRRKRVECPGHGGYFVHDYLKYNPRKSAVEKMRLIKRQAGQKGAKLRWGKQKETMASAIARVTPHAMDNSMPPSSSLKTKDKSSTAFDLKGEKREPSEPRQLRGVLGDALARLGPPPTLEQDLAAIEAARKARP